MMMSLALTLFISPTKAENTIKWYALALPLNEPICPVKNNNKVTWENGGSLRVRSPNSNKYLIKYTSWLEYEFPSNLGKLGLRELGLTGGEVDLTRNKWHTIKKGKNLDKITEISSDFFLEGWTISKTKTSDVSKYRRRLGRVGKRFKKFWKGCKEVAKSPVTLGKKIRKMFKKQDDIKWYKVGDYSRPIIPEPKNNSGVVWSNGGSLRVRSPKKNEYFIQFTNAKGGVLNFDGLNDGELQLTKNKWHKIKTKSKLKKIGEMKFKRFKEGWRISKPKKGGRRRVLERLMKEINRSRSMF